MKRKSVTYKWRVIAIAAVFFYSCVEPFNAVFEDFDSALVIEGTITNEFKQQRIVLTRTYEFEDEGPVPEINASVSILTEDGGTFDFQHIGDGIYLSSQAFAAQAGSVYELEVTTQDGRLYGSSQVQLTTATNIDEIRAERITNDQGEDGMGIFLDSFDPSGNSKNYRYEFQETYRVIAPTWTPVSLVGDPEGGCGVIQVPDTTSGRICYPTDYSNTIIITSTEDLNEDRVSNFMVRFINRNNYIISHRYSILVRQFVLSNEAYTYFETLNELSGSESLFSQTQPGFLQGNVFSKENSEERVLGYFDVASVDEHRIFFNYEGFYPDEPLPPYVESCKTSAPPIATPGGCVLRPLLESGLGVYVTDNEQPPPMGEGPYLIAPRVCGDCTQLGTTEIPEFWTE